VSVGGDGWVWRCVDSRLAGSDEWSVLIVMVGGEMYVKWVEVTICG